MDKIEHVDSAADQKFAKHLVSTLDKSLDEIDEISLQRLKKARARAQVSVQPVKANWISMSVAASVLVLVLLPIVAHNYIKAGGQEKMGELVAQEVPLSSEELDDIEMLMALEDTDA